MMSYKNYLLLSLALALLAPSAWAEKEVVIRRLDVDGPPDAIRPDDGPMETEKVTYLGVMTGPVDRTLSSQLGLPKETGLVVSNVMEKSPASDGVKRDDVLTKLDDQLLIDTHQLSVLVRSRKHGDEVKLTFLREGKEMSLKVKLGEHEVSKGGPNMMFHHGAHPSLGMMFPEGGPGLDQLRELPGMGPDGARDVLHMIEHERGNFVAGPGVRILGRGEKGSTILDLPKSNVFYSDDDGSIEIKADDGKRNLTVKDAKGVVAFNGPINTEDDRKKLPPAIAHRLEKLETDPISFEVGDDFKPDVVPLPPEPTKTKISRKFEGVSDRSANAESKSF